MPDRFSVRARELRTGKKGGPEISPLTLTECVMDF